MAQSTANINILDEGEMEAAVQAGNEAAMTTKELSATEIQAAIQAGNEAAMTTKELSAAEMQAAFTNALNAWGGGGETAPASSNYGTGSYTIPAGYWGKVSANVRRGEIFYINGVGVLYSDSNTWSTINSSGNLYRQTGTPSGTGAFNGHLASFNYLNATQSAASPVGVYSNSTGYTYTSDSNTFVVPAGITINSGRWYVALFLI